MELNNYGGVEEIPIELLTSNPYQVRIDYDEAEMDKLQNSIRSLGILSPIIARRDPSDPVKLQIAAGHRRCLAARNVGLETVPVIVRNLSDEQMIEINLVENLERSNLNPIEEALGYNYLMERMRSSFKVAKTVGKEPSYIRNCLRLLELDPFLKECVVCDLLEPSKALLISRLPEEFESYHLADLVIDFELTRREIRQSLKKIEKGKKMITWDRVMPVAELWEHPRMMRGAPKGEPDFVNRPLLIDPTGLILDFDYGLEDVKRMDLREVKCTINYEVCFLRKGKATTINQHPTRGISPKGTDEKRLKLEKLNKRLQLYNKHYPVNVVTWKI